jgi:hypothetical protein
MPVGKHSPMENSSDANPGLSRAKKYDVFSVFDSPHPKPNLVASPPQCGRFSYAVEAVYESIEINAGLFCSPCVNRIVENRLEIGFR